MTCVPAPSCRAAAVVACSAGWLAVSAWGARTSCSVDSEATSRSFDVKMDRPSSCTPLKRAAPHLPIPDDVIVPSMCEFARQVLAHLRTGNEQKSALNT